jgi:hypothetical protein
MPIPLAPLELILYGVDDEVKRRVTRSIVPWGILERAIDLQAEFESVAFDEKGEPQNFTREQIALLTDFVAFIFDHAVTPDEIRNGASLTEMFSIFRQIFARVSDIMQKNPTLALNSQKQNLQKVRQGK